MDPIATTWRGAGDAFLSAYREETVVDIERLRSTAIENVETTTDDLVIDLRDRAPDRELAR